MADIMDAFSSLFGGGAAPAQAPTSGLGIVPGTGVVAPSVGAGTAVSNGLLPGPGTPASPVLARLPAGKTQGGSSDTGSSGGAGAKGFMGPMQALAGMKVQPGDRWGAFAQGFGAALKAGADQASAEAKAALAREELLRKRANDLFDQNLKTRTANREDRKEGRDARKAYEDSEEGGYSLRKKTGEAAGLKGDALQRYALTGDPEKDGKKGNRNPYLDAKYREQTLGRIRQRLGLANPELLSEDQRKKAEAAYAKEVEQYDKMYSSDEDAPGLPKDGDASNTKAPPPASPATPAAPAQGSPAQAAPQAAPQQQPAAPTPAPKQPDPSQALKEGLDAIQRGADPSAVQERLRSLGVTVPNGYGGPPPTQ